MSVVGRKVRQGPIDFGTSAVFEVDYVPEVEKLGQRPLRSAGYTGFAHVEMAYDQRDGQFKPIEVNTRPPVGRSTLPSRPTVISRASLGYVRARL
jgi:predicted ATP-grasp superfamily ATP-dependent carboligase